MRAALGEGSGGAFTGGGREWRSARRWGPAFSSSGGWRGERAALGDGSRGASLGAGREWRSARCRRGWAAAIGSPALGGTQVPGGYVGEGARGWGPGDAAFRGGREVRPTLGECAAGFAC